MLMGPPRRQHRSTCRLPARSQAKSQGTTSSVVGVANSRPPITARARAAFCSSPAAPIAIGIMPTIIAAAVISTGRMRVRPAAIAASRALRPAWLLLASEGDQQDRVRRSHADRHDGAHQRGDAERRAGGEQHGEDAAEGRRQRQQHDQRVAEVLVVDDHQQVDQHGREQRARCRDWRRRRSCSRSGPMTWIVLPGVSFFCRSATTFWISPATLPRSRPCTLA